jgi:hypothetical protein
LGPLRFTPKKKCESDHEVRGPQNIYFKKPTLSTNMIQRVLRWERQKRCSSRKRQGPVIEKCCYNKLLTNFFGEETMKTREDNRMVKLDFFSPSKLPFLDTHLKRNQHIHFLVDGSFLLVHIRFTPLR